MIALTRQRTAVAIPPAFRGAKRRARELVLLTSARQALRDGKKLELKSSLWKPAKKQLIKESGEKCGYCEASSVAVCHCDVEHIRPKATYWWLALCVDNYVLACQLCNQTNKRDRYPVLAAVLTGPHVESQTTDAALRAFVDRFAPDPLDDSALHKRAAFEAAFRAEQPALVNPYLDAAEDYFTWMPDAVEQQVKIVPRAAAGHDHWRAKSSIELLGLDREELRRARWITYGPVAALCQALASGRLRGDPAEAAVARSLRESMEPRQFFAGLCRWTIREQFGLAL